MKSQAASYILFVLLLALFHDAECAVAKYTRIVSGRLVCKSVFDPSKLVPGIKVKGSASCQAKVTYVDSSDKTYTNNLNVDSPFTTNTKGQFSIRLPFTDNNRPSQVPLTNFQVSCQISSSGQVKSVTASGDSNINAGDIPYCMAVPLQFKGALFCSGSSPLKPISKAKMTTICDIEIQSTPPVERFTIGVGFDGSKADGSFERSTVFRTELPPTAVIQGVQTSCSLTPPPRTSVASTNSFVVKGSGVVNFGSVLLAGTKICKP